jgi:ketosteroid isomerase-like protein
MKKTMFTALTAVSVMLMASCSGAEPTKATPAVAANAADIKTVIENQEREWVKAILAKDPATIDRLLADDFIGTTNDQKYSKEDAIADVKSGMHESLELDDIDVRVWGDTAVATMGQEEKSRHGKEDFSGHYLFTNVWIKLNGQWRAVASHGSRVR